HDGYTSASRTITARDGETVTADFALAFDLLGLSEVIIVTGTVSGKSKLESAIAATTLDEGYLQKVGARNTADAFKSIPGFYIESSGGEGNANFVVRGLPIAGGAKFSQIQEDGLDVTQYGDIMFGNTDIWIRLDQSVERVEGIRGGSASITASNAPGGIINMISKTGGKPGGSIAQTVGLTFQQYRLDFDYGSPISENLRFHIGGFYRTDEGVRSPGYTANQGGQIKGNVTRTFDDGYVRLYFKYLDDRSIAYLPIPLARESADSDDPEGVPGFDPNFGTMHSRDLLRLHARTPFGDEVNESLDVGMNPMVTAIGGEAEYDFGDGWTITERFRRTDIDGQFNSIFSFSGSPLPYDQFAESLGLSDYTYTYAS
ncbi:MAG: TonB-dependent receptor plug domain-containing protein, partial [Myxococcota bacterium]